MTLTEEQLAQIEGEVDAFTDEDRARIAKAKAEIAEIMEAHFAARAEEAN